MPRIITLSNATECSLNNPYYRVIATIRERYQYEWIEQILVNELSIFPVTGRTHTLSFQDFPSLADVFNLMGVTGQINLTFKEDLLILDMFVTFRTRDSNDNFIDPVNVLDTFSHSKSSNKDTSFSDVLSLNDSFVATPARGRNTFFADQLSVADQFVLSKVAGSNVNFLEAVIMSEVFNVFEQNGQTLYFDDAIQVSDLPALVSVTGGSNLSFNDVLFLTDQFAVNKTSGRNLNFQESVAVSDAYASYIQRYDGSRCKTYVDRVEADGGEVVDETSVCAALGYFSSTSPTLGYSYNYNEAIALADVFNLVGLSRTYKINFNDVIDLVDSFTPTVTWKNKIFLEDNLSIGDLFSINKQVQLLLSFLDSVQIIDTNGTQTTVTRGRLSFTDGVSVLDVNERFIQRYEGTFCQTYVERVEADGGQVVDPLNVCTALGYFSDGANPTTGYRLTFQDVLGVLTFESVVTNVKRTFTFAFMDDIGPAEIFSTQRSRNFTLSFTEQLDLSASN